MCKNVVNENVEKLIIDECKKSPKNDYCCTIYLHSFSTTAVVPFLHFGGAVPGAETFKLTYFSSIKL